MNISIVSPNSGSPDHGMVFRSYYMAREFGRFGHAVSIITGSFSHTRKRQFQQRFPYYRQNIDGIEHFILWVPTYRGNGFGRVLSMVIFALQLVVFWRKIASAYRPDVVIASAPHPLSIYGCYLLSKNSNSKLIFEVRDLWPLSVIELGGYTPKHPFIRMLQHAEDFAVRNCDKLVSVLALSQRYFESRGLLPEKFHYIPNGIDQDASTNASRSPILDRILKLKSEGNKVVGYAGAHGLANYLDKLLTACEHLKEENIYFILIGDGPYKNDLISQARARNLSKVEFFDSVSKSEAAACIAAFDIGYIGLVDQPLFQYGVSPNKLMDYMGAGIPVVQAIKTDDDIVKEANCGTTITDGDTKKIAAAFLELSRKSEADLKAVGQNGKTFINNNRTYAQLARRYIRLLEN